MTLTTWLPQVPRVTPCHLRISPTNRLAILLVREEEEAEAQRRETTCSRTHRRKWEGGLQTQASHVAPTPAPSLHGDLGTYSARPRSPSGSIIHLHLLPENHSLGPAAKQVPRSSREKAGAKSLAVQFDPESSIRGLSKPARGVWSQPSFCSVTSHTKAGPYQHVAALKRVGGGGLITLPQPSPCFFLLSLLFSLNNANTEIESSPLSFGSYERKPHVQLTPCPGRRLHNCYYCITIPLTFSPVLPSFLTSIVSCCGTRIFGHPPQIIFGTR